MKMDGGGNLVLILVVMIFGLGLAGVGFGQFPLAGGTLPGLPTTLGDSNEVPGVRTQGKTENKPESVPDHLTTPIGKNALYEDAKIKLNKTTFFNPVQSSPNLSDKDSFSHALSVSFSSKEYYFPCTSRWPAKPSSAECKSSDFGGVNPNFTVGTLLALGPNFDLSKLKTQDGKNLAKALQTYGAYVGPGTKKDIWQLTLDRVPTEMTPLDTFNSNLGKDIRIIFENLKIITNNSPTSVGGGS